MVTATNQLTIVASLQDRLTGPLKNVEKSTGRMEKQFTKLSGAIQNAFQFYVRYRIFGLINRGISAIENAIPGLVARGQEWAQTVDSIADSSGLAAEKSSLLAGSVQVMTGDAEGLTKALGALSQQVVNHGDVMRRYGIETRNANGQLLDTWTILGNVRRATADLGNGFITTAAARDLFSRGGQTMMDFLTMSDEQFKMLTRDVKASGVVMTDVALQAADQWGRTQQRFEQQVTGIANQIVSGVQPLLSKLVDGITGYLRSNMAQIVGFVTGVISFVAGAIAGFLGIDLDLKTFAERFDDLADKSNKRERQLSKSAKTRDEQTSTEDGYTRALNDQIDAIDRQLAAMSKVDSAQDARREHARLMRDISEAQKELRDLRGESVFAAGMSAAEAELARQAHAADIVDAQKRVGDAREKLEEQERKTRRDNLRTELQERKAMLQERLADHVKTLAEEAKADREVIAQALGADKGGIGAMSKAFGDVGKEVRKGLTKVDLGEEWGKSFRRVLQGFWDDLTDPTSGLGAAFTKLKDVALLVAENWRIVAAVAGVLFVGNVLGSFTQLAVGLAIAGPALLASGGFIAAIVIATAAVTAFGLSLMDDVTGWQAQVDKKIADYRGTSGAQTLEDLRANIESGLGRLGPGRGLTGIERSFSLGQIEGQYAVYAENIAKDQTLTQEQLTEASGMLNSVVGQLTEEGSSGTVFDALKTYTAAIDERLGESGPIASAAKAMTAAVGEGGPIATAQLAVADALGDEGAMADAANQSRRTAALLRPAGTGTVNQNLGQLVNNTRGLNTSLPWGIANVTIDIDGRTAARMAGIPIRRGNSTTRVSPTT